MIILYDLHQYPLFLFPCMIKSNSTIFHSAFEDKMITDFSFLEIQMVMQTQQQKKQHSAEDTDFNQQKNTAK